jgi:hypothetical protein
MPRWLVAQYCSRSSSVVDRRDPKFGRRGLSRVTNQSIWFSCKQLLTTCRGDRLRLGNRTLIFFISYCAFSNVTNISIIFQGIRCNKSLRFGELVNLILWYDHGSTPNHPSLPKKYKLCFCKCITIVFVNLLKQWFEFYRIISI